MPFFVIAFTACSFESISLDEDSQTGLSRVVMASEKDIDSKEDYRKIEIGFFESGSAINLFDSSSSTSLVAGKAKLRGNSTIKGPKKPYTLKLGEAVSTSALFGSDLTVGSDSTVESRKYVLIANYPDPSMLRNSIALAISGSRIVDGNSMFGFEWTVNHRFVDLYLNDEFNGTYLFTDHTQSIVDHLGFNVSEGTEGYIIENDHWYDEEPKFRSDPYNLPSMIKWPKYDDVAYSSSFSDAESYFSENTIPEIRDKFNEKLDIIKNGSWEEIVAAIDVDSFVKFLILNNLASNTEVYYEPCSVFLYQKSLDGKLYIGPVWDHDRSFKQNIPGSLMFTGDYYFADLFSHSEFQQMVKNGWNQLKSDGYISDCTVVTPDSDSFAFIDYIDVYIDEKVSEIKKSWRLNSKVYGNRIMYPDEQMLTLEGNAYVIKRYLRTRASTMDEVIEAL